MQFKARSTIILLTFVGFLVGCDSSGRLDQDGEMTNAMAVRARYEAGGTGEGGGQSTARP